MVENIQEIYEEMVTDLLHVQARKAQISLHICSMINRVMHQLFVAMAPTHRQLGREWWGKTEDNEFSLSQ